MKQRTFIVGALCLLAVVLLSACQALPPIAVAEAQSIESDEQLPVAYSGEFPRLAFDTVMPTGQSVAVECQESDADYPYAPYDWPDASATLEIRQGAGHSTVAVEIRAARPNTYYSIWLRLKGEDASGVGYGGSPFMGIPGTPLIPTSELGNALATFSEPNDTSINGFHTDENGDASFYIELDFPIINGAYPFQKFVDFDASDERFLVDEPSNRPVAIAGAGAAPFTLRVASHCTDGTGHGLLPGPHEGWFDWAME